MSTRTEVDRMMAQLFGDAPPPPPVCPACGGTGIGAEYDWMDGYGWNCPACQPRLAPPPVCCGAPLVISSWGSGCSACGRPVFPLGSVGYGIIGVRRPVGRLSEQGGIRL